MSHYEYIYNADSTTESPISNFHLTKRTLAKEHIGLRNTILLRICIPSVIYFKQ